MISKVVFSVLPLLLLLFCLIRPFFTPPLFRLPELGAALLRPGGREVLRRAEEALGVARANLGDDL